jgi:hypothetical protein
VTRLNAGIADNVIPDRAVAHLNFRFAPDRDEAGAVEHLREIVPADAELTILGTAPSGRVATGSPIVAALLEAEARGIEPKQAWTNVADFTQIGLDAVTCLGSCAVGATARRDRRPARVHDPSSPATGSVGRARLPILRAQSATVRPPQPGCGRAGGRPQVDFGMGDRSRPTRIIRR